eukprot:jgi/Botrbrau1/9641/Bobra.0131s0018.1
MSRFHGLVRLVSRSVLSSSTAEVAPQIAGVQALKSLANLKYLRNLSTPAGAQLGDLEAEIEHATGLEKYELEGKLKGEDVWHEAWVDAPWGTETNPVEVTSAFTERIVGVPDPADDAIIWWGKIKKGDPPRQIVEGGEFFVLKQIADDSSHGHH